MMKRFRSERGQSLLEFALILMVMFFIGVAALDFGRVFLMVMFFIGVAALDFGRVFFATIVITNASREGARYLTQHPEDSITTFSGTSTSRL